MELTPGEISQLRFSAQCLGAPAPDVEAATGRLGAVNAQFGPAAQLALLARCRNGAGDQLAAAIERRRLATTWLMRGTLHLAAANDLPWMVALLGPVSMAKSRSRRHELGLTDQVVERGVKTIRAVLAEYGALTRDRLVDRLIDRGVAVARASQASYHLIRAAALLGVICVGPPPDWKEPRYVLVDAIAEEASAVASDAAPAMMARTYLRGYGPATERDFAAWSGLSVTAARAAWRQLDEQQRLTRVNAGGHVLQMLGAPRLDKGAGPVVRLLPAFDTYVLGYGDRDLVVAPEHQAAVYHGGQTVPVVAVDGTAVGVWRYERRGRRLAVEVTAFRRLEVAVRSLVGAEAERVAGLLGGTLELSIR